jgi:chromosomal replication initiator protein
VLVVDDIQFIAGKQTVQQEFFHTFNDVVERGGQIVLISDRPPQQIGDLEDRLRSRFAGGLIIDISPPDFELKTAITLIKAKERGIDVDIEAAKKIAEQAEDNRMLEGILLSSYARALVTGHGEPTTTLQSRDVVLGGQNRSSSTPQIEQVLQTVCLYYQIKPLHLRQPNRTERVAHARHILMYILRVKLGLGLAEIARFLKRKDHTTILHGVQKIQENLLHNTEMRKEVVAICQNTGLSTDL